MPNSTRAPAPPINHTLRCRLRACPCVSGNSTTLSAGRAVSSEAEETEKAEAPAWSDVADVAGLLVGVLSSVTRVPPVLSGPPVPHRPGP
ncbi:hypothetical protein ACFFX0_06160 [Citricoccus parietis]|uniref:Uncharacterized protein n=1 Tax=Citricoccus parietis TaxID=592307 RepID=A0ABV5FVV5_9MICC